MNKEAPALCALVGMPGAGKSEAAIFFKSKGFSVLRFGDQVDIGLKERGQQRTEVNERAYREELRRQLGMAAMAIKIEPRIAQTTQQNPRIVLDGLYSWSEYKYLKQRFPQLIIICIFASPKTRYERLEKRLVRPLNYEIAQSRDYAEIENIEKGGPIAMADTIVINEGSIAELTQQLEQLVNKLL